MEGAIRVAAARLYAGVCKETEKERPESCRVALHPQQAST